MPGHCYNSKSSSDSDYELDVMKAQAFPPDWNASRIRPKMVLMLSLCLDEIVTVAVWSSKGWARFC